MGNLFLASITDFFLDPIVNAGTEFISTTGLPVEGGERAGATDPGGA